MKETQAQITQRLADVLQGRPIDWAIVCGSGLGTALVDENSSFGLQDRREISLAELGLPTPRVAGHGQSLVWGTIGTRAVCLQTGRLHPYEGHPIAACTAAVQAMIDCGAQRLLLTAATGALHTDLRPGQLVLLRDQMNLFGPTPLVGARFIDCSQIYTPALRQYAHEAASRCGMILREAVYAHARGPQYETPAEVAALRLLGGDVVGMSTTYEAILGAAAGIPVCGLALVTNAAAELGLSHEDVQRLGQAAHEPLAKLLRTLVESVG